MKNYPKMLKIKLKKDDIGEIKHRSEKHDHENILKSLKNDIDYYRRNIGG